MNIGNICSRRLLEIAGSAFYPPEDRRSCVLELAERIKEGKKVF